MKKSTKIPSQKRAIATRNTIIEVAKKMFLRNGYKRTNTIIIAKEADLSVGIVYSYFKDKKELFEIWLNELLERCDDYFYNQMKLTEYDVELKLIISNILEKVADTFLISPIMHELDNKYVKKTMDSFLEKAEGIFIKACNDVGIFVKNPNETAHIIFVLILSFHGDYYTMKNSLNKEALKLKYVQTIESLLKN